jgi:ribosomal protein S18 acetylase RimI-like enzyme
MTGVEIRSCARDDLAALEWDGAFAACRAVFAQMFEAAEAGRMAMLIATRADAHVGQIWIDLDRDPLRALLWALRVKPAYRGLGIGAALVAEGERVARRAGRTRAELEVEPVNTRARRLYERLGYVWVNRARAWDVISGRELAFELDVLGRSLVG